jgi:hypothetical protein
MQKLGITRIAAAIGLAMGLAGPAAATAYTSTTAYLGSATTTGHYLGSFAPGDSISGIGSGQISNGAFTHWWLFNVNPDAADSSSFIFNPIGVGNVTGFTAKIYGATFGSCTFDTACAATQGSLVTTFAGAVEGVQTLAGYKLTAGNYMVQITGTVTNQPPVFPTSTYSGNMAFSEVPAPGVLALLGVGMLGMGAVRRKIA